MEGKGFGSGLETLAEQFFAELSGTSTRHDDPPERSDQTLRIKLSSTPWVVPTAVDRRFEGQETVIPKLQRLNPASPFAGVSPVRSPLGAGGTAGGGLFSPQKGAGAPVLDPFRQPSRDSDRFDLPVRTTEDPSVLPIQLPPPPTPAPPAREVREPAPEPATQAYAPFTSPTAQPQEFVRPITATPGKQIFKSPPPQKTAGYKPPATTAATPAPSALGGGGGMGMGMGGGFLSPTSSGGMGTMGGGFLSPLSSRHPQPQSVLKSPTPSVGYNPQAPPSTTRKRVTFSASVEDAPSERGLAFTPQPRQQQEPPSFLSPYAAPSVLY